MRSQSSTDATEPVCASGVPACRGWAPEPQLQAILLNPVPLSPSPLKIQNNGWVEREDPRARRVWGEGLRALGLWSHHALQTHAVFMA